MLICLRSNAVIGFVGLRIDIDPVENVHFVDNRYGLVEVLRGAGQKVCREGAVRSINRLLHMELSGPSVFGLRILCARAVGALSATKISKAKVNGLGGSWNVHIRLNLQVDVHIIAKVKGDIVIVIL
jgi:hypothetical protein